MKYLSIVFFLLILFSGQSQEINTLSFDVPAFKNLYKETLFFSENKYVELVENKLGGYKICTTDVSDSETECERIKFRKLLKADATIVYHNNTFNDHKFEFFVTIKNFTRIDLLKITLDTKAEKITSKTRIHSYKTVGKEYLEYMIYNEKSETYVSGYMKLLSQSSGRSVFNTYEVNMVVLDKGHNVIDDIKMKVGDYFNLDIANNGDVLFVDKKRKNYTVGKYNIEEQKLYSEDILLNKGSIFKKETKNEKPQIITTSDKEIGVLVFHKEDKELKSNFYSWNENNQLKETLVKINIDFIKENPNNEFTSLSHTYLEKENKSLVQFGFFRDNFSLSSKSESFPYAKHSLVYAYFDGKNIDLIDSRDISKYSEIRNSSIKFGDKILLFSELPVTISIDKTETIINGYDITSNKVIGLNLSQFESKESGSNKAYDFSIERIEKSVVSDLVLLRITESFNKSKVVMLIPKDTESVYKM